MPPRGPPKIDPTTAATCVITYKRTLGGRAGALETYIYIVCIANAYIELVRINQNLSIEGTGYAKKINKNKINFKK